MKPSTDGREPLRRKLDDVARSMLWAQLHSGRTEAALAQQFGVSEGSVRMFRRHHHIPRLRPGAFSPATVVERFDAAAASSADAGGKESGVWAPLSGVGRVTAGPVLRVSTSIGWAPRERLDGCPPGAAWAWECLLDVPGLSGTTLFVALGPQALRARALETLGPGDLLEFCDASLVTAPRRTVLAAASTTFAGARAGTAAAPLRVRSGMVPARDDGGPWGLRLPTPEQAEWERFEQHLDRLIAKAPAREHWMFLLEDIQRTMRRNGCRHGRYPPRLLRALGISDKEARELVAAYSWSRLQEARHRNARHPAAEPSAGGAAATH